MTDDRPWSRLDSLGVRLGQFRKRRHQDDQAVRGTNAASKSAAGLAMQVARSCWRPWSSARGWAPFDCDPAETGHILRAW
jgi:hypothetical protein